MKVELEGARGEEALAGSHGGQRSALPGSVWETRAEVSFRSFWQEGMCSHFRQDVANSASRARHVAGGRRAGSHTAALPEPSQAAH